MSAQDVFDELVKSGHLVFLGWRISPELNPHIVGLAGECIHKEPLPDLFCDAVYRERYDDDAGELSPQDEEHTA